jgi:K+-sensing histidine kinase KdpD
VTGQETKGGADRKTEVPHKSIATKLAHELKNPLMAIKGLASTGTRFYDDLSDDERKEFFELIGTEADRLVTIAEQTAMSLQIENGEILYHVRRERLEPLAQAAIGGIDLAPHPVEIQIDAKLECTFDAMRVRDVLVAGLDNAAKFSPPEAPITVRAASGPGTDEVLIEIADLGAGVAEADRERVFERYVARRPPGYEDVPGAGLSLYIARAHITALGGRIWMEDNEGGGSALKFTLPTNADIDADE